MFSDSPIINLLAGEILFEFYTSAEVNRGEECTYKQQLTYNNSSLDPISNFTIKIKKMYLQLVQTSPDIQHSIIRRKQTIELETFVRPLILKITRIPIIIAHAVDTYFQLQISGKTTTMIPSAVFKMA